MSDYEAEIHIYAEILKVFNLAKKQFVQQGIHQNSQQDWLKATEDFSPFPWVQKAQQKVSEYLAIETSKVPLNKTFLATSDIIESIFGKYKIFAASSPNSEINEMILTIPLSTTKITPDKVIEAMETIQLSELTTWSKEVFGQSMISKRKAAFSVSRTA